MVIFVYLQVCGATKTAEAELQFQHGRDSSCTLSDCHWLIPYNKCWLQISEINFLIPDVPLKLYNSLFTSNETRSGFIKMTIC